MSKPWLSDLLEGTFAGRWIAGPEIRNAIDKARELKGWHIRAIINYLGEQETEMKDVEETVGVYKELIEKISKSNTGAEISLKATQIGMSISDDLAKKNYAVLASLCRKKRVFLWLDMEEYELVGRTIALYLSLDRASERGICIQSYLKRSIGDLRVLAKKKAVVRLVKGAHAAEGNPVYENREKSTMNYYLLMDYLFKNFASFTIGTHDPYIIEKALKLNKTYKRDVTYAMLNGIRDRFAAGLAEENKVSIYVPFGRKWIEYSYRRMKELNNLQLILTSIARGGA